MEFQEVFHDRTVDFIEVHPEAINLLVEKGFYPEGLKYLGRGSSACAYLTHKGTVLRIGRLGERPDIPGVLQPYWVHKFDSSYAIEELPYAPSIDNYFNESWEKLGDFGEKTKKMWRRIKPLIKRLEGIMIDSDGQRYYLSDRHPGNIGIYQRKLVVIDPDAVRRS